MQVAVPESEETAGRASEDDVVRRSSPVLGHSEVYERVLLLSGGPGLRPHRNLWSRHHHRRYVVVLFLFFFFNRGWCLARNHFKKRNMDTMWNGKEHNAALSTGQALEPSSKCTILIVEKLGICSITKFTTSKKNEQTTKM